MANEKRLIDANAWKSYYTARKESLEAYDPYYDGYEDAIDHVDDWMDAQPTVDAVPLEQHNELKEKYKRLLETADILDAALREYQRKYGDLEGE